MDKGKFTCSPLRTRNVFQKIENLARLTGWRPRQRERRGSRYATEGPGIYIIVIVIDDGIFSGWAFLWVRGFSPKLMVQVVLVGAPALSKVLGP